MLRLGGETDRYAALHAETYKRAQKMRVSNPKNLDYCVRFVLLNHTYALVNAQHISANTPINYFYAVFSGNVLA